MRLAQEMRYEVRVIEAGRKNSLGALVCVRATKTAAEKLAVKKAHDYHYGTAILDNKTGLVDYGNGFEAGENA